MTAITALTAQNTVGVDLIEPVSPEMILAQIRAVADDIGIDAIKIGMLGDRPAIEAVATGLDLVGRVPIVLDPVMVSESGANLLAPDARQALVSRILPRATVATPNIPEARVITGLEDATQEELARGVLALGAGAAVITGGHSRRMVDLFVDGRQMVEIEGEIHAGRSAHGSGCTHSSVLAAMLAWGHEPLEAARLARVCASRAVAGSLDSVGSGPGPVDVIGLERPADG